jgi:hypothetical protein
MRMLHAFLTPTNFEGLTLRNLFGKLTQAGVSDDWTFVEGDGEGADLTTPGKCLLNFDNI